MVSLFLVICMTDNNGRVIFVIWIVASSLHSISPGASITMLTLLLLANFLLPAQPKVWPAFPFIAEEQEVQEAVERGPGRH